MKNILDLKHDEARDFFVNQERYFTFDLPPYFQFDDLLCTLSKELTDKRISDFYASKPDSKPVKPENCDNVNYKLFSNKDGKYAWRLFELIHPALYVDLVHIITKRDNWQFILDKFSEFGENSKVECVSIPIVKSNDDKKERSEQILTWWQDFEQSSIKLSLKYKYLLQTDITDCYGSLYTHTIPWALHTKKVAKHGKGRKKLLGDEIDYSLRQMRNGQTNGIPQGSVLMDFVAEMVLGSIDVELTERINESKIKNFKILRYRDDYRIFVNNPEDGKRIIKDLSQILSKMGMRLGHEKTNITDDIVLGSVKKDKIFWLLNKQYNKNIEKQLLIIYDLSKKYPNSGSLIRESNEFYTRILDQKQFHQVDVIVSIVSEMIFHNPRIYAIASSIIGKILYTIKNKRDRLLLFNKVEKKLSILPNSEMLGLWLQRIILKTDGSKMYKGNLSQRVLDGDVEIWNSDWLNNSLKNKIRDMKIIDIKCIKEMDGYPSQREVALFESKSDFNSY